MNEYSEQAEIVREFVHWLLANDKTKEDAIKILTKNVPIPVSGNHKIQIDKLSPEFKNLVILYTYHREVGPYQLPDFIQMYRNYQKKTDVLPDINEAGIILEAYKSEIYKFFIQHLLHAFIKDSNNQENFSKIEKVNITPTTKCPICGRTEGVLFTTCYTSTTLCNSCLANLLAVSRLLDILEPDFITTPWYLCPDLKNNIPFSK